MQWVRGTRANLWSDVGDGDRVVVVTCTGRELSYIVSERDWPSRTWTVLYKIRDWKHWHTTYLHSVDTLIKRGEVYLAR